MDSNIKILHLEDEPSDALLVSYALKQTDLKYEILVVKTKEKFLSSLNDFDPDLILADHSLPSFNSFEALELLEKWKKKIPTILVTASMQDEFAVSAIKKGAKDYVLKDRLGRLPSAIKNVLKTQRLEKERETFLVQLQRNERRFRRLIENGADAVAVFGEDGTPNYVTPSIKRILGYSENEALKLNIFDIIHENHREFVQEKLKECLAKPQISFDGILVRARHKDATWRWIEATATSFVEDPAVEGIVIDFRDVTDRKFAEKAIKESEEKYRQLFENGPLPNIIYDKETLEILDVNKASLDHYGYTRNEFLELTILDFLPQEENLNLKKTISELPNDGGEVNHYSSINVKKNGERIQVETFGYGLQYKKRNCRLVICLDITEKEVALQKLKEKTEKLLTAEKLAKSGYWEIGLQENYFYWSDQVYRIWGRKKEEFQVDPEEFRKTIHPEDLQKFEEHQLMTMEGTKDLDYEHRIILPNGEIKWVHEKGKVIKDQEGKPLRLEGSVQDITERKNSLEKLVKSEARFRGLIQSQTNYVIRIGLEGMYTYCNKKFSDDFGWIYGQKEIVGQNSMVSIKEYHQARVQETVEKCLANPDQVFPVEIDKPAKGGGLKTTLWDFIFLKGTAMEPGEIQCVGVDITDRVKAEQELKESNIRYELVSKATSDEIYDLNLNTNIFLWGEAVYAMFGYSKKEFPSTIEAYLEKIHPEEKHHIAKNFGCDVEGAENHRIAEYRFKKADGNYASVIEKGFILRDENGKAYRMVGAIQDVTEKKKLEQLLDEASRFARIGSFEIDCQKNTMYWSPVTKEIHEVDMDYDPTLEEGILFYKKGESRNSMSSAYKKALEENIPYDVEFQIVTAKGKERWVRKIGRPTFVDGKCMRINGSFQDITNIKNSELEALKASEEKEIILESIGDAFFMVDNNWIVTYWNQHSEKLLECPKSEIKDKNLWDVLPDTVDTQFYSCYHKAVKERSIENFEEYFERAQKWFEVTAYPSNNGLSVYLKDVTERKESELQIIRLNNNLKAYTEELVEANKGLEQFSFIVSHNLRSPVANILGLADLISNEGYPEEVRNKFLNALFENVKRLDIVISDLNAILQVKVEMDAKKEPVLLNNLVDAIKTSIHNLLEKEEVQITTNFDVPAIHTVQSYLHSIFYNLIANSIKYRRSGIPPQIDIRSETKEGSLVITFEDNGLGIDLAKKGKQVFGLYKRFHHHIEGKGMGLFLVKTQVELLGGNISIASKVNTGTKFTISFKEETLNYISEDEKETALYGG